MRPNDPDFCPNIGWMKCVSGDVAEWRRTLHRTIELNPTLALAYYDLRLMTARELEPGSPFVQETGEEFFNVPGEKE